MKEFDIMSVFEEMAWIDSLKADNEEVIITIYTYYDGHYTVSFEDCYNIPEDKIIQISYYSEYKKFDYSDISDLVIDCREK